MCVCGGGGGLTVSRYDTPPANIADKQPRPLCPPAVAPGYPIRPGGGDFTPNPHLTLGPAPALPGTKNIMPDFGQKS